MNVLIPVIFSALNLTATPDAPAPRVDLTGNAPIEMIIPVDTLSFGAVTVVSSDVLPMDGGSRRIIVSYDADGLPVDIIDGGSWGAEGFLDIFYFTDRRKDTLTAWFKVADTSPRFSEAPEGGMLLDFNDCVSLTVLNHDSSEQEVFILRDNQVSFKMDSDGKFNLISIRPKPNDLKALGSYLQIYHLEGDSSDAPLDMASFSQLINRLLPLPGKKPAFH